VLATLAVLRPETEADGQAEPRVEAERADAQAMQGNF